MNPISVPRVSSGAEEQSNLEEFRTDPIGLMLRIREERGDLGCFQLADKQVIVLTGSETNPPASKSSMPTCR